MERAIYIYNPMSGDHTGGQKLDLVLKYFQNAGVLIQPYRLFSNQKDNLADILRDNEYKYVVVSGGDGTLNYVANTILSNGFQIPMGIIPSGTCNDFAHCANIPHSVKECANIIIRGKIMEVDAGLINDKQYFLSTCAGGMFVDVSFNTHHDLKRNFGPLAYYLKAISEVANIKTFNVKVETEDECIEEEVLLFLILNGQHAGGFHNLIEEADVSDGIMDIVLVKNCSHIDMASLFFKVLASEDISNRNVVKLRAKSCRISGDTDIQMSVDGEKGDPLPISVRFINKALKIFVP